MILTHLPHSRQHSALIVASSVSTERKVMPLVEPQQVHFTRTSFQRVWQVAQEQ